MRSNINCYSIKELQTEIKENFFQLSKYELKAVLEFILDIVDQRVIIPDPEENENA